MTRRNIVGMLLSRFNYNRVTVTIVHISVREWLPLSIVKLIVSLTDRKGRERLHFEFLHQTVSNHFAGRPTPSLLPSGP